MFPVVSDRFPFASFCFQNNLILFTLSVPYNINATFYICAYTFIQINSRRSRFRESRRLTYWKKRHTALLLFNLSVIEYNGCLTLVAVADHIVNPRAGSSVSGQTHHNPDTSVTPRTADCRLPISLARLDFDLFQSAVATIRNCSDNGSPEEIWLHQTQRSTSMILSIGRTPLLLMYSIACCCNWCNFYQT